jgi:MFS family permease
MADLPTSSRDTLHHTAWSTVALLWPVALLNYLDRMMLSTMGLSIKADITELQSAETFGQLMAIFMWVYAFCSPLGGMIADRLSRKWLIVASLAVWSGVTLLMGYAQNFSQLYWLRAIMGVSEAFYIPAGLALIADHHRGPTRSMAVGFHMSGIYMGQALGGVGGWVAQEVSWRTAFTGCGFIGVAYAFVLVVFLRDREKDAVVDQPTTSVPMNERAAMNWLGFILLLLCFALPSLPGWAVKNWLPTLLQDRFAMSQASSGMWATMTASIAGFFGVLIGGRCSDVFAKRHLHGRTWVSAAGLMLLVPALIGIGIAPAFWMVMLFTALYGVSFGMFDTNNMPILCQVAPASFRATGYGLMNLFGIGSGAYLTPLLGKLKDQGVPLSQGFALCAVPAIVAVLLMLLLRPSSRDYGRPS